MRKLSSVALILLFISFVPGKSQVTVNAELRPRFEMRDGYKQLSDTISLPAFFVSQRSRIGFGITKEKYSIYFSIQDVRVWGDEQNYSSTGVTGDNASIDLKEAWVEYFVSDHASIKFGRQELKYADQRLIGARNWNQNGMSYDALIFKYKGNFTLDAGISYNNDKELPYQELYSLDKMKTLDYICFEKKLKDNFSGSLIYVASGFQNLEKTERIYFKNTPGILLAYSPDDFTFSGSAYYQFGKNREGNEVSAYFWSLISEYSLKCLSFTTGVDFISGHNFASTDSAYLKKDHLFDILYGSRHKYYGSMDYFSNVPKGTSGGGLIDIYFDTEFHANEKLSLSAIYHYFRLQNNVIDPDDPEQLTILNKSLANEVDFLFSYKPAKEIKFELGYSFAYSSKTLNKIQKISSNLPKDAHWVYLSCTFSPSVILGKKDKE